MNAARFRLALLMALFPVAPLLPALAQDDGRPAPIYNLVRSGDDEADDDADRRPPQADDDASAEPFARVRALDGSIRVQRKDGTTEDLVVNGPVYGGDKVRTADQRLELQLPDGSLARLDVRSMLEAYSFWDPESGGGDATLIGLSEGSLSASAVDPRGGNRFRIDTPAASIYPLERATFRIDIEDGDQVRVSVERGRVEVTGEDGSVIVRSGERTRVRPGGAPRDAWSYNVMVRDNFDAWTARRDEAYEVRGATGREYRDLPEPVRPYYAELSRSGKWVWTDEYGWTWKPSDVATDWRPYVDGSWSYGPYGPVWVGAEPWGWSVYRYGRWEWSLNVGWFWIPGRIFRPAHVYWYYGPSYVGWCPLGYWDYPVYAGLGWSWGDPWFDGYPWAFVGYHDFYHHHVPRVLVTRGRINVRELHDGVVMTRPVLGGGRPGIARGRELSPDAFAHARELAARRGGRHEAVAVRDAGAPPRAGGAAPGTPGGRPAVARHSFVEREREVARGQSGTGSSGSGTAGDASRGATRRDGAAASGGSRSGAPARPSTPRGGGAHRGGARRSGLVEDGTVPANPRGADPAGRAAISGNASTGGMDIVPGEPRGRVRTFPRDPARIVRDRRLDDPEQAPAREGRVDGRDTVRRPDPSPDPASRGDREGVRRFFGRIADEDRQSAPRPEAVAPRRETDSRRDVPSRREATETRRDAPPARAPEPPPAPRQEARPAPPPPPPSAPPPSAAPRSEGGDGGGRSSGGSHQGGGHGGRRR